MSSTIGVPCEAEKTKCQLKLSPRTCKVTGGHLIPESFAGCTEQLIRAPWHKLEWETMICICIEQMRSWTTLHFGIWHLLCYIPEDRILQSLPCQPQNTVVLLKFTACYLLSFSSKQKLALLNAVLGTVLTLTQTQWVCWKSPWILKYFHDSFCINAQLPCWSKCNSHSLVPWHLLSDCCCPR